MNEIENSIETICMIESSKTIVSLIPFELEIGQLFLDTSYLVELGFT